MEWISIKDELPRHKQEIKFKGAFPFECKGFFENTPEGGYIFWHKNYDKKKIYQIYGVTHWMPLPKIPEKDD